MLRKLRLLLEQFPKRHTLILLGQPELMYTLALKQNTDLKTRITYPCFLKPLTDEQIQKYILNELTQAKLGIHTFDEAALEVITRSVDGNLRLCRNLCYYSLVEACRQGQKQVSISHVNSILMMPHWRTYEEVLKQKAKGTV